MNQLLAAFLGVTRFRERVLGEDVVVPSWQLVLGRSAWGLIEVLLAWLVLWLAPHERFTGTLFALIAVCVLRYFVFDPKELRIFVALSSKLSPSSGEKEGTRLFQQALFNLLLLVRPACIFCLLLSGNALWLMAAAALGMTVACGIEDKGGKTLPRIWLAGGIVTLVVGILLSRCCSHPAMLLAAALAMALCWIFPSLVSKWEIPQDKDSMFTLGEALVLAVGVLGQAL